MADLAEIEALITQLGIWNQNRNAVTRLIEIGSPALDHLLNVLRGQDFTAISYATAVLSQLKDLDSIDPLIDIYFSNPRARSEVRRLLIGFGESVVDYFLEKLKNSEMRLLAADILGEIRSPQAVDALVIAFNDENRVIRRTAAFALGKIGDPTPLPLLIERYKSPDSEVRNEVKYAFIGFGLPAVKALAEFLDNPDPTIRIEICDILHRIRSNAVLTPLLKALDDSDQKVRMEALKGLFWMGEIGVDGLIMALQHPLIEIRQQAAYFLGRRRDKSAIEPLIQKFEDEEPIVRRAAAEALGRFGHPYIDIFFNLLRNAEATKRAGGAIALGSLKHPSAIKPLIEMLNDADLSVRVSVIESLGNLKYPYIAEYLIPLLQDPDLVVQESVAKSLKRLGTAEALSARSRWKNSKRQTN